jgi:cysteine-rich repeat protein
VTRISILALASLLALGSASATRADIDLTGRWYARSSTTGFAEIVQTGTSVTMEWHEDFGSGPQTLNLSGTFNQTSVSVSDSEFALGAFVEGENVLHGGLNRSPSYNTSNRFFSRCECDDGNVTDGDGCSSDCRVEDCYTCTGEPSSCIPSTDGAPCNDRSDCTTGETCSSGTCGAGTPLNPCTDVTGRWRILRSGTELGSGFYETSYVQENGVVVATAR